MRDGKLALMLSMPVNIQSVRTGLRLRIIDWIYRSVV